MRQFVALLLLMSVCVGNTLCMKRDREDEKQHKKVKEPRSSKSTKENSNLERELFKAIAQKDHTLVHKLIKQGVNINTRGTYKTTPLIDAVKTGDSELVRLLLSVNAQVNAEDKHLATALMYAAYAGNNEIVRMLAEKSKPTESNSKRALILASACGHLEIVQSLIDHGVPLDATELGQFLGTFVSKEDGVKFKGNVCPLIIASYYGHRTLVEWFIKKDKFSINTKCYGRTPLTAAIEGGHRDIVLMLLKHGAKITVVKTEHPLIVAVQNNRYDCVKELFDQGHFTAQTIEYRTKDERTALMIAAQLGYDNIIEFLVEKYIMHAVKCEVYYQVLCGAVEGDQEALVHKYMPLLLALDVKERTRGISRETPLMRAAKMGKEKMVKLLLSLEASYWDCRSALSLAQDSGHKEVAALLEGAVKRNTERYQQLLNACSQGDVPLIKELYRKGEDISNEPEKNPLMLAAQGGHREAVSLLLEHSTYRIEDALLLAVEAGHTAVVKLLLAKGALNPEREYRTFFSNEKKVTPLMRAVEYGYTHIVEMLLSAGADIFAQDKEGHSALAWAKFKNNHSMVSMLEAEICYREELSKRFLLASSCGNVIQVKELLEQPIDTTVQDEEGRTALELAIVNNHKAVVELLIGSRMYSHVDKVLALQYAAKTNDSALIKFVADKLGERHILRVDLKALECAAMHGNENALSSLINMYLHDCYGPSKTKRLNVTIATLAGAARGNRSMLVKKTLGKLKNWPADGKRSLLTLAAANGSLDIVKLFIQKGCPINEHDEEGSNALIAAAQGGFIELMEFLLEQGIDNAHENKHGISALACAAGTGQKDAIQILLKRRVPITKMAFHQTIARNHEEIITLLLEASEDKHFALTTALFEAVMYGRTTLVGYLIKQIAHLNVRTENNKTLLMVAIECDHWDIVELLIASGVDLYACDAQGRSALQVAQEKGMEEAFERMCTHALQGKNEILQRLFKAVSENDKPLLEELLKSKAHVSMVDERGRTLLIVAAQMGNRDLVELLLRYRADVNACDKDQGTALTHAAALGHEEIVKLLMKEPLSHSQFANAMQKAAHNGHDTIVLLLLSESSSDRNEALTNALHAAALGGRNGLVSRLLDAGATINARSSLEQTPLMWAAWAGHKELVQTLLTAGADVTAQDTAKQDALEYAKKMERTDVVNLLQEALSDKETLQKNFMQACIRGDSSSVRTLVKQGVTINYQNQGRVTALMHAAHKGHADIVYYLLEQGAQVTLQDIYKRTALAYAVLKNHKEIAERLLQASTNEQEDLNESIKLATENSSYEMLLFLMEKSEDKTKAFSLALTGSSTKGRYEIVEKLLDAGGDILKEKLHAIASIALKEAAGNGHTNIIKLLLSRGALLRVPGQFHLPPALQLAAENGHLEAFTFLVGLHSNTLSLTELYKKIPSIMGNCIAKTYTTGPSAFFASLKKNYYDEILLLARLLNSAEIVAYLKDPTTVSNEYIRIYKEIGVYTRTQLSRQTLLMWACMFGHKEVVKNLLAAGLPATVINTRDIFGRTALMYALFYGHKDCALALLDYYAKEAELIQASYKEDNDARNKAFMTLGINLTDNKGETALFYAVLQGDLALVNKLLVMGARLSTDKRKVALALKIAAEHGWKELLIRLLFKCKNLPPLFNA